MPPFSTDAPTTAGVQTAGVQGSRRDRPALDLCLRGNGQVSHPVPKRLIVCADDFGLDPAVNQAVEEAHRSGILTAASLMVTAPAAADAVRRARALPGLRVGLHLDLLEGCPVLPARDVPDLISRDGRFDPNMVRAGLRFSLLPGPRRQLAREIRAQFEAFRATGLALDHVNGHKHVQLHPTVARLLIEIGPDYGMRAMRLPAEPAAVLRRAFPEERLGPTVYRPAVAALGRRLRRAGIGAGDQVFGIAWSGRMVEERLGRLLPHLPNGVSEIYCHPAVERSPAVAAAMPGYRNREEFAALTSARLKQRIAELGIELTAYGDLAGAP